MERTKLWTLLSVVTLAGCALSTERDELGTAEQELTPKLKIAWTQQFGTNQPDRVVAATTFAGAVYVAGTTGGALAPPLGGTDSFLRKYDANGTIVWTRQYGSDGQDEAHAIVADATGVYVGGDYGTTPRQGFVIKYDHDGQESWRGFVAPDVGIVRGLAIDATGLYIAGQTSGQFTGQPRAGDQFDYDAFIAKWELAGDKMIWVRQFGTTESDVLNGVFVDATGVYVAGSTGGVLGATSQGGQDAFVRKYGLNGELVGNLTPPQSLTVQFGEHNGPNDPRGDARTDSVLAITGDTSGIYVTELTSAGDNDNIGFLRKLDRNLVELWHRQIAAGNSTVPFATKVDSSGVIVAGLTNGAFAGFEHQGEDDIFARKFDRRGKDVWVFQTGTTANDQASALAIDGSAVYVGGGTSGNLGAPPAGNGDAYVFKLVPNVAAPRSR